MLRRKQGTRRSTRLLRTTDLPERNCSSEVAADLKMGRVIRRGAREGCLINGNRHCNPSPLMRRYQFLRLVCNDHADHFAATKQPDGQISKKLSSRREKNITLNPSGKSALPLRASHPLRGALRTSRTRGWDAVDADSLRIRTQVSADGEVVWSWRPGAGAKFREKQASQG